MIHNLQLRQKQNYTTVVIHSTDNSFGFGIRKNNDAETDELFIKEFDKDLCNNLIVDFNKFISKEKLQKVNIFFTKKSLNNLRILHITNFNERLDGRLFFNTGRRINNGFIRLGHSVLGFSDRDIQKYYKSYKDLKGAKN